MSPEHESFKEAKARKKRGARGKLAEDKVHQALTKLKSADVLFDFDRLLDARAAGRPVTPTVSDFTFSYNGNSGALEVKQTKHAYRLRFKDFPQFPRMKRRAQTGAQCLLAVYHTEEKVWRLINVAELENISKGSWDLRKFPLLTGDFLSNFAKAIHWWRRLK